MNANQSPPSRVKAAKIFYANIAGTFGAVHPGDVVEIDRPLAAMMVASSKAIFVTAETPLVRQTNYLPDRLKNPPVDPATERLDRLQASVEKMAESIALLVAAQAAKGK